MDDRWLSVDGVSGYLGVSKHTVNAWVSAKGLPGRRDGMRLTFKGVPGGAANSDERDSSREAE
jgi:excisionase family DNA binding protein